MTSRDIANAIFDDMLVPLAESAPQLKLDWAPDQLEGSYFQPAYPPQLTPEDMARSGADNLIEALRTLWTAEAPALLPLLPELARLAEAVEAERDAGGHGLEAPSTLVYQMW